MTSREMFAAMQVRFFCAILKTTALFNFVVSCPLGIMAIVV